MDSVALRTNCVDDEADLGLRCLRMYECSLSYDVSRVTCLFFKYTLHVHTFRLDSLTYFILLGYMPCVDSVYNIDVQTDSVYLMSDSMNAEADKLCLR